MEIIGSLGVLIGVIVIIYLSVKEVNIIIAAPLATSLVILFNQMDPTTTLLGKEPNQFMGALSTYILNYFAIFLLGSILAKLMETSGETTSIADYILKKVGHDSPYKVLVAIFLISAILTYGGISLFVVMFAVLPLARSLFKKMDLAWNLIQVPLWLGIATFTMTILPGTPAIQNVIPIQYLDTSLTAAAIPSIVGSIGCVTFGLFYMKYCLAKSMARGETYATYAFDNEIQVKTKNLPHFLASILPLLLLIIIALTGSLFSSTSSHFLTICVMIKCKTKEIEMTKEVIVESFELDHTIVKAPYVRLISEEFGPKGDRITNFDVRLVQPNQNSIETAGLHTIEHLLAKLIRQRIDGMIDCSPFGCRTGFHLIMWGKHSSTDIAKVIKSSLEEIATGITWEDVPGTTLESCGNYKDHSLFAAKEWAQLIIDQGISDDPFSRHVI